MCKWGIVINEKVTIPARLSYTGKARMAIKGIDACIALFVRSLNANGVLTESSCCGHGKGYGLISLASGAEIHLPVAEVKMK